MAKGSRNRRRATISRARRGHNSFVWYILAGVIVVLGVVLIVMSRQPEQEPVANRDHWHAAFGVNVCGEWLPNISEFHTAADNPSLQAGIHSHGDGLIHIHPFASGEAGDRATVGRFLEYAGYEASSDSFTMWDGQTHSSGDECDGEAAVVRWSLNGEEQGGSVSSYHPKDQDVIALALLPEDAEIGEPPSAANIANPVDVEPGQVGPTDPSIPVDTAPEDPVDTAPEDPVDTAPEDPASDETTP